MKTEIVTSLKRSATKILADLHSSREPVLITEHGKPSAYLVDADDYLSLQNRISLLEGLAKGERAIQEKRTVTHEAAKKYLKKWLE